MSPSRRQLVFDALDAAYAGGFQVSLDDRDDGTAPAVEEWFSTHFVERGLTLDHRWSRLSDGSLNRWMSIRRGRDGFAIVFLPIVKASLASSLEVSP